MVYIPRLNPVLVVGMVVGNGSWTRVELFAGDSASEDSVLPYWTMGVLLKEFVEMGFSDCSWLEVGGLSASGGGRST